MSIVKPSARRRGRATAFAALIVSALPFVTALPAAAQQMPALPVSVAEPVKRKVVDWTEFPGRFDAVAMVEVRAQVAGALESVGFKDGATVKKGELLFVIDPRPFEAAMRQAQANVEVSQTRLDLAQADLDRAQDLRRTGNIPEATFQQRQQSFLEARGAVQASKAALERAQLDLGYTRITAPISGRIGRKLVSEGNLITAGAGGTLLTTIVQYDPVQFYFDIDEQSFLSYVRAVSNGSRQDGSGQTVYVALSDETEFKREGKLDFLANQVDPNTGTIRVRAEMRNPGNFITPGLFGRVRLATGPAYDALVLPDEAVMLDQNRRLVMTVTEDGTVQPRPVEIGPRIGKFRVIRQGLQGNEKVIVNGLMRARPGGKVVPQPAKLEVPEDLTRPNAG